MDFYNSLETWQLNLFFLSYSFLRYFLVAGIIYFFLYVWKKNFFAKFKIQNGKYDIKKIRMELQFSASSILIYSLLISLIYFFGIQGWSQLQFGFDPNQWPVLFLSLIGVWLFHETWYYFFHKLLHGKYLMQRIHKYHHLSRNINPFSTYSVHPVEFLIVSLYLVVLPFLFPVNFSILLLESFLLMIVDILWHAGFEFFPKGFLNGFFLKYFNTSTFHNLHHTRPMGNFSLILRPFDQIFKTERPEYAKLYAEVQDRRRK